MIYRVAGEISPERSYPQSVVLIVWAESPDGARARADRYLTKTRGPFVWVKSPRISKRKD